LFQILQVSHVQPGVFWVQDASGSEPSGDQAAHTVSFGDANSLPSCDCLDWQRYHLPCKHLCSVFSSFPDWGWDMLNANYTANPLINLDYSCIKPWVDAQDKQENRLTHYSISPTFNLKENSGGGKGVDDKSKADHGIADDDEEKTQTLSSSDIKISGVELEVPMVNTTKESIATSSSAAASSGVENLESITVATTPLDDLDADDEETADIALQCRDLLTNLAHLSSKRKHGQIEKLKADLEASIRMLQEQQSSDKEDEPKADDNDKPEKEEGVTEGEISGLAGIKRPHDNDNGNQMNDDDGDEDLKRLRVDLTEKSESDVEGSYVSDDEEPVGLAVDASTDIEDETVEINTGQEEDEDEEDMDVGASTTKLPEIFANEDIPIRTILTRPQVPELTPEQRERKLLAILTASSV